MNSFWKSKQVVVTGGAGFIGSNITNLLTQAGALVTVLDNFSSGYRCNVDCLPNIRIIEGDIRDRAVVEEATRGTEVVFHLAASVGNKRSIDDPLSDSQINVIGTLNVLESARTTGVRRIVFSSSAGIFGELKTLPIAEDHPQDPDSPYGTSKLAAEKMCLVYNKLYGMRNVCLRYFNVYGPNQRYDAYGNVIPIFANRVLQGRPMTIYGDGEQTRDFVNVRDVAAANLQAASSPEAAGAFNIGSGTRVTINSLARMVEDAARSRVGWKYAPPRPGDVRDSQADIRQAEHSFGFAPSIELTEGLTEYMSWIRQDPLTIKQLQAPTVSTTVGSYPQSRISNFESGIPK